MAWPPTSEDRERAFREDGSWFRIQYECDCGHVWEDEWSCIVDDECDVCGATIEGTEIEELPEGPQ